MIYIPQWDFKWQGIYNFRNPIKIPEGSTLVAQSAYDNTAGNPNNPNNPPITVNQGESTTEEMMLCFAAMTYYFNGDENIVIDNSPIDVGLTEQQKNLVSTVQLYNVYPNPSKNNARLDYFSPLKTNAKARIISSDGKLVKEWEIPLQQGFGTIEVYKEPLSKGQYFISLEINSFTKTRPFIVNE